MKKFLLSALLILSFSFISSCGTNSSAVASPPISTLTTTTPSPVETEEPAITEIKETFSAYADEEYILVSASVGMTVVDIFDPNIASSISAAKAAQTPPADWESLKSELAKLSTDLPLLTGTTKAAVYVRSSENGEIYLTLSNGSILFDVFAEVATFNADTISLAEFNQIATGMTYDEVVQIIGSSGTLLSESGGNLGPEYYTALWMWEGEGIAGANANVMFQGGGVVSKAQFGLE